MEIYEYLPHTCICFALNDHAERNSDSINANFIIFLNKLLQSLQKAEDEIQCTCFLLEDYLL